MLESEIVWSSGKWQRRDYATIPAEWFATTSAMVAETKLEVSASRDGVNIDGMFISGEDARVSFLDIFRRAWRQHQHLKEAHGNNPIAEDA